MKCYSAAAFTYKKKKKKKLYQVTSASSETNYQTQLRNHYIWSYLEQVTSIEE